MVDSAGPSRRCGRRAHRSFQGEPLRGFPVHLLVEHDVARPSGGLGAIHGGVRVADHGTALVVVTIACGDADAGGQMQLVIVDQVGFRDRVEQRWATRAASLFSRSILQQHDELVAAES